MEQEEVVYLKVFDKKKGDVVFEGKVSTDVEPGELAWLRCFRERGLDAIHNKSTGKLVESFKGLQNNVELVSGSVGDFKYFAGVLYVGADDGVVRKSTSVPSCECVVMSVWHLSNEECEKVFKCETLEELGMYGGRAKQIPREPGKMKKLKKLRLVGLHDLKSIPEEIGGLSNLEELCIDYCQIESLPKRLKDLKMLKSISFVCLFKLLLNAEDLVVLSKLKHLAIWNCGKVFTPSFTEAFWEMIKATTELRVLELYWNEHNHEMVVEALEENGSIVDGAKGSQSYAHFFKRNKENHERAFHCVVHLLAIRRWRNVLNNVPKEMVRMIAMMLRITKRDVGAWSKR